MTDIKITKLPDKIDPHMITANAILEKYRKCPFCGEAGPGNGDLKSGVSWLWWDCGYKPLKKYHFWEKHYPFSKFSFKCRVCGAKWESPEFPNLNG